MFPERCWGRTLLACLRACLLACFPSFLPSCLPSSPVHLSGNLFFLSFSFLNSFFLPSSPPSFIRPQSVLLVDGQGMVQCAAKVYEHLIDTPSQRGYGATAARLTPDQKVGSSNLSGLNHCTHCVATHESIQKHAAPERRNRTPACSHAP